MNLNNDTWHVTMEFRGTDRRWNAGSRRGSILDILDGLLDECRDNPHEELIAQVFEPGNDREYILVDGQGFRTVRNIDDVRPETGPVPCADEAPECA